MAGQNTFPILLLNDAYMIKEHYKTRMKLTQILDLEETETHYGESPVMAYS